MESARSEVPDFPGRDDLVSWFGEWPSFHDAEVLEVKLDRSGPCWLKVHYFRTTPEVDAQHHYITDKHAIVTFRLEGVTGLNLEGFSHQNVVSDILITRVPDGFRLWLGPCFGLMGEIIAGKLTAEIAPGMPNESIYRKLPRP